AVWASAVAAGIIASSRGRDSVAAALRSTVRRDRCFFEMYMASPPAASAAANLRAVSGHRHHLELVTGNDPFHDRGHAEVLLLRFALDGAHRRPVVCFLTTTERVHRQLLGEHLGELALTLDQGAAQVVDTLQQRAFGQLSAGSNQYVAG